MARAKWGKTAHGGHTGSGRKSGYGGIRPDAKDASRKARREADKRAMQDQEQA